MKLKLLLRDGTTMLITMANRDFIQHIGKITDDGDIEGWEYLS